MPHQESSLLLLLIALLVACSDGGSGVEDGPLMPVAQQSFAGSDITITDNGDGTLTFATSEAAFTVTEETTPRSDNIYSYFTPSGARTEMAALIAETEDVRALVVLNGSGVTDTIPIVQVAPGFGASIERMTETTLPTQGSVEYTGAYLSRFANEQALPAQSYSGSLAGNVSLTADFASGEVSGAITDRVDGLNHTYEDISIGAGTVAADGTFTGSVTGGEYTYDGRTIVTAGTGDYTAILGGPNGEDIVGGLVLT